VARSMIEAISIGRNRCGSSRHFSSALSAA